MELIPDRQARNLAETTFDRNVVVVAGAGTGKTTLLVNRLVHLLIKEPRPVTITQIVALTFTNKAATEMKVRLRERLLVLANPETEAARVVDGGAVSVADLRARYGLSTDEVAGRAAAALHDLEKGQIGTLHSFAAHLLRLYPLEGGVDPTFQEDDGLRFEEHFSAAWEIWVDRELSRQGSHHQLWRRVLGLATLDDVRALARALCSELVDLDVLHAQINDEKLSPVLVEWVRQMHQRGQVLLDAHDRPKRRKIEQMLAAAVNVMKAILDQGAAGIQALSAADLESLGKDLGNPVAGWEKDEFGEAESIINTAQQYQLVNSKLFKYTLILLGPLVSEIRLSFRLKGWVSFDGLLARARTLLRDHLAIRERIKQDYRAVLVDEFQDTDPVQYELMLAISECVGAQASTWQEMALEPGKLFIVGDPKQSIYAFRRADIEAFDRVVQKIEEDGGVIQTLTTNFRSDAAVLGPVNDVFDRLFERRALVQPANVRLEVQPQRRPSAFEAGVRVHVTLPVPDERAFDAAGATRAEGETLARWLAEEVLSRPQVKPGHIALLFRKLTQADTYVDALRRYGLPYVIEGEKHFYRRQEVIDLMNVLRVLDHPHDNVALAGVLRSPLGGLSDRALYDLRQVKGFDYLRIESLSAWTHPEASSVRLLYGHLAWLHRQVGALPLAEVLELIFDRLPLLEIAAASVHGEQAVANLLKVKHTAAALSDRPHLTLSGFVDLMVARLEEQPDEAESPLSEESSNAIQVLTIHKAKGLEFPIVVLPGLHQGSGRERGLPVVTFDWSSGSYGLSLGGVHNFGAVLVHEKQKIREDAERRRVLYVGMTRAKDMLILSGGMTGRAAGETVLGMLQEIGEGVVGASETETLTIGASVIPHRTTPAPSRKRSSRPGAVGPVTGALDSAAIAKLWGDREDRWKKACRTPRHLTPSTIGKEVLPGRFRPSKDGADQEVGRLVGILAHHILEQWDFHSPSHRLLDRIEPVTQQILTAEQAELMPAVADSLRDVLGNFARSDLYQRLALATILGREVPFAMSWEEGQIVHGMMDVIYRLDDRIWIGDYKTDQVTAQNMPERAERYRSQMTLYKAAAQKSLGVSAISAQLLFLRCGVGYEL
ncbi:MAG: UvrD-helicase domain-containing protein [Nitrospira sp.]|nr:UvrD-helicase domain-containing protein [Nitrospira sp.]